MKLCVGYRIINLFYIIFLDKEYYVGEEGLLSVYVCVCMC